MSGLSWKGRQCTSKRSPSAASSASAPSRLRLPTQHHGQMASETTSIRDAERSSGSVPPAVAGTSHPSGPHTSLIVLLLILGSDFVAARAACKPVEKAEHP